jgi:hypothetical protein
MSAVGSGAAFYTIGLPCYFPNLTTPSKLFFGIKNLARDMAIRDQSTVVMSIAGSAVEIDGEALRASPITVI